MLVFRISHQCAELVHVVWALVAHPTDGSTPPFMAQEDFAHAPDSVLHSVVIRVMTRRGAPEPVVAAHVRDMRNMGFVFEQESCRAKSTHPAANMRHECSLSPLVFRCVVEGLVAETCEDWSAQSCGFRLDSEVLQVLTCAERTWFFAVSRVQLGEMTPILRREATRITA